jgi:putative glutamine amidotransferase
MSTSLPLVGVPACVRQIDSQDFHVCGDKYLRAVSEGAGALPIVIPAQGDEARVIALFERLDGLLVTGSRSDIHPSHYGGGPPPDGTYQDVRRDATTLPLIRMAVAENLPMLCICRGHQELNVALGGTLFQQVHAVSGRRDHRADYTRPVDEQYGLAHEVELTETGFLREIMGADRVMVNSAHGQGINRLADALEVEAVAPDGQIEAVRVPGNDFTVGVQWHPEWKFWEDRHSTALFKAFGEAVRRRAALRME